MTIPARSVMLALASALLVSRHTFAADIDVKISSGMRAAYDNLKPAFESRTANKLVTVGGASAGATPTAIPARLKRGEATDVVIVTRESLDALVKEGLVVGGTEVDLALSPVGAAVRAGAATPDISTVEALKRALSGASTIAYYDNGSGDCLASCQVFRKLGVDTAPPKFVKINSGPGTGAAAAKGDADIVFNQLGELLPVAGVQVLGAVPEEVQSITVFSGGVAVSARSPAEARALLDYLASPEARPAIEATGLRVPRR
jgi:molybdate transport system substrate-binding protein